MNRDSRLSMLPILAFLACTGALFCGHGAAADEAAARPAQEATLSGRVVDPAGLPVPGATLTLFVDASMLRDLSLPGDVCASTRTDESGRFALSDFPTEDRLVLRVDHDSYATELVPRLELDLGEHRILELRLRCGEELRGIVVDSDGAPIAGAEILVVDHVYRSMDPTWDVERVQLTDEKGDFWFGNLNTGYKSVTARRPGYASETRRSVLIRQGGKAESLSFFLGGGSRVTGVVRESGGGAPIPGVVVHARPVGRGDSLTAHDRPIKTDAHGRFAYEGLAPGSYSLVCQKRAFETRRIEIRTGGDAVQIELERRPVARGRVVDAVTGKPVPRFSITLSRSRELVFAGSRQRFEDPAGRFEYVDLATGGEFYLIAQVPGHAGGRSARLEVRDDQDVDDVLIPIVAGTRVRGRVVDASGRPVKEAVVELLPEPGESRGSLQAIWCPPWSAFIRVTRSTVTAVDGSYAFEHVLDGTYRVRADHARHAEGGLERAIVVPPDEGTDLADIVLLTGGTVRGIVRVRYGDPEAGAKVWLTKKGSDGDRQSAVTDGNGAFSIGHLVPGTYFVDVFERGGELVPDLFSKLLGLDRLEVTVGDGEDIVVEVVVDD